VDGLNTRKRNWPEARAGDYALVKHWSREAAFWLGHFMHALLLAEYGPKRPRRGGEPKASWPSRSRKTWARSEAFKKHYSAAAVAVEGSGWAVLAWQPQGKQLVVLQSEKH
jgi:Fe-Mn family superoxide dismutase